MIQRLLISMMLLLTAPLSATSSVGFEDVATIAIPAVVSIRVAGDELSQNNNDPFDDEFWSRFFGVEPKNRVSRSPHVGLGSGFLISPEGYILTNNHIVNDAAEIKVILTDGREFDAVVVGSDKNTDIALIKIEGSQFPYLTLGSSEELKVGQWVVAIGNPLGLQTSLTVGVVSATGRDNLHISAIEDFIQTDAAINQGNSGGPLLNLQGQVIGMNTAIATSTGGYMGIGFAIPSNIISRIRDQLITTGNVSRGFVGVTLQYIDQELADAFGLLDVKGALVADVIERSPAEKAGLMQGDVIVSYNGETVTDLSSIRNTISLMPPGTEMSLTIQRGDKTFPVKITVGSHPKNVQVASKLTSKVGFDITPLTPEVAEQLGYNKNQGVVINNVTPSSAAELAGLRRGQLIVAVNQKKVSSPKEFYQELESLSSGKGQVLLLVKQGQYTRFISIRFK